MKADAADTVLDNGVGTGTEIVSGLLGLKALLKMPHRQTMDL